MGMCFGEGIFGILPEEQIPEARIESVFPEGIVVHHNSSKTAKTYEFCDSLCFSPPDFHHWLRIRNMP